MGDRCTGHCCQRFTIPYSPKQLRRKLREKEGAMEGGPAHDPEFIQIARMVVPLGRQRQGEKVAGKKREKAWYYTCRHFIDGQCSIYATRPSMCSDYPYGGRCLYAGCTWTAVRKDNPAAPPPMSDYGNDGLAQPRESLKLARDWVFIEERAPRQTAPDELVDAADPAPVDPSPEEVPDADT